MATRSLEDLEHTLRDEETIVKALKDSLKSSENSEDSTLSEIRDVKDFEHTCSHCCPRS